MSPILRTADDEQHDYEQTLKNFLNQAYREWPNGAGFDGLEEERGPIELKVVGTIPSWAAGSLYRTGPGQSKIEGTSTGTHNLTHWFDGLAHTHRFDILPVGKQSASDSEKDEAGSSGKVKVLYSSRRQSEAFIKHIQTHGARDIFSFGQRRDPCIGLLGKLMSTFQSLIRDLEGEIRPIQNVSVVIHADVPGLVMLGGDKKEAKPTVTSPGATSPAEKPNNLWTATDNCGMKRFDPSTLEPIGAAVQSGLHPDLKGPLSCSHAQRDPVTGDFYNYNLDLGRTATYRIFRVSAATGKTEVIATIRQADAKAAYIHSFFLSESFVILCVPSSHFAWGGMKILWEHNMIDSISPFDASQTWKWLVVDRLHGAGVVAELESGPGFFFHTVNAFEEREEGPDGRVSVYCDVIEFPDLEIIRGLYYDIVANRDGAADGCFGNPDKIPSLVSRLARYKLSIPPPPGDDDSSSSISGGCGKKKSTAAAAGGREATRVFAIPSPHAGELPTINPAFATRRHRYVYTLPTRGLATMADAISKVDTATREALLWTAPPAHTPGEAIFVARPGATDEDDGVLLSLILDGAAATSYLVCLDARTMRELGRAEAAFAIGLGFHGLHLRA